MIAALAEGLCLQSREAAISLSEALAETLVVRDLLDGRDYDTLTHPWTRALGTLPTPACLASASA
ncbi:hypothetical protein ABZ904_25285 [Streptomyces sp. NPDC046900]|uniref:hypothetical protein n=1 Tax=Streptomyces sp. NPDC046900 TaxID=3155473 RepID=UPI0033D500AD